MTISILIIRSISHTKHVCTTKTHPRGEHVHPSIQRREEAPHNPCSPFQPPTSTPTWIAVAAATLTRCIARMSRRSGFGGIAGAGALVFLLALVIWPLTTHPFRDRAPFLLLTGGTSNAWAPSKFLRIHTYLAYPILILSFS